MNYADLRPTHVRVLGRNIAINYDHADTTSMGQFDDADMAISIEDGLHPVEEADTVLHEIMHAIWWLMAIGKPKTEEQVVRPLATGLTQVFQDNPALVQYLTEANVYQ